MKGTIMLIAGLALAIAAPGCTDDGEHPGRDSTPNVKVDSVAVPGSIADTSRPATTPPIPQTSGDTISGDTIR